MRKLGSLLATLLLAFSALPAQAQLAPVPTDPLEIIVSALAATHPTSEWLIAMCDIPMRTKYEQDANDLAIEAKIPGIRDRMVAASAAYCAGEIPPIFAGFEAKVRADWRGTPPAQLARLATLLRPALVLLYAVKPDFRPGDTATMAADRFPDMSLDNNAEYKRALTAFVRSPGAEALITRLDEYRKKMSADMEATLQEKLGPIFRDSIAVARDAGNAYAREKGFAPPYPA